jgi:hypothetical protein
LVNIPTSIYVNTPPKSSEKLAADRAMQQPRIVTAKSAITSAARIAWARIKRFKAKLFDPNQQDGSKQYSEGDHPDSKKNLLPWALPRYHNLIFHRNKTQERLLIGSPEQPIGDSHDEKINPQKNTSSSKHMRSLPV